MMQGTYLTHARVVLEDRVLEDSAVLIEDGRIAAIEPAGARPAREIAARPDADAGPDRPAQRRHRKEAEPRSRVLFPLDFAVAQVDRRNAAAGITTPYHALSFANSEWGVRNNQTAAEVVRAASPPSPQPGGQPRPLPLRSHRPHGGGRCGR